MKLSVIIPVYKAESYLKQCVDSVLNQHLQDYEIILVDDGSPDACPQICDEYAGRYPQIKVIHQKNAGAASARNVGLMAAQGEYIMFIDSDDWWNPNVDVNIMINVAFENPQTEMYLFTSLDYVEGEGFYRRSEHNNLGKIRTDRVEHYYSDLIDNGNLEVSACTKILKRSFLLENGLTFATGRTGEDNQWMIRSLRKLKYVSILNEPLYLCRIDQKDSVTHNIGQKNIKDLLYIVEESQAYYKEKSNSVMKYELCFCSYLWFSALGLYSQINRKDKQEVYPVFKKTADVCKYSNSSKTRLAYTVYKMCGIKLTSFLLGIYIRLRSITRINREKVSLS